MTHPWLSGDPPSLAWGLLRFSHPMLFLPSVCPRAGLWFHGMAPEAPLCLPLQSLVLQAPDDRATQALWKAAGSTLLGHRERRLKAGLDDLRARGCWASLVLASGWVVS